MLARGYAGMVSLRVTKPSQAILGGGDSVFSIGVLLDLSPDADYGKRITGRPIGRKADGYRGPDPSICSALDHVDAENLFSGLTLLAMRLT